MKRCNQCHQIKEDTEFYKKRKDRVWLQTKCKACKTKYTTEDRRKHPEQARIWERKSSARPEYVAHRKKYEAAYRKKNPEKVKALLARYPEKNQARSIYRAALDAGKLVRKPCEKCGNPKSDGHHTDYTKPLLVRWLCRKHHMEQHRKS